MSDGSSSSDDSFEGEYEVEQLLDRRRARDAGDSEKWEYLVRWKGFTADDDTWEPEKNLSGCESLLEDFKRRLAKRKKRPATAVVDDRAKPAQFYVDEDSPVHGAPGESAVKRRKMTDGGPSSSSKKGRYQSATKKATPSSAADESQWETETDTPAALIDPESVIIAKHVDLAPVPFMYRDNEGERKTGVVHRVIGATLVGEEGASESAEVAFKVLLKGSDEPRLLYENLAMKVAPAAVARYLRKHLVFTSSNSIVRMIREGSVEQPPPPVADGARPPAMLAGRKSTSGSGTPSGSRSNSPSAQQMAVDGK